MENEELHCETSELIEQFGRCGSILLAIGDENRQKILAALIRDPGLRVEEIREHTELSRPAVSHHLKVLKDAEAVTVLRKGTKNFYFPNCDHPEVWVELNRLTSLISDLACRISTDESLEKRRRAIIDEYDY